MKKAAYIGWLGHNNIGDEACFYSIDALLKGRYTLIPWDNGPWLQKEPPQLCILGGGTILDIRFGRREKELIYPMIKKSIPLIIWGSGIVSPHTHMDLRTLEILNYANFVGVRGPQSKKILDSHRFLKAEIIGDPALFLSTNKNEVPQNKIAINIGYTRNNLFGTEQHVIDQTKKLIALLEDRHFNVELFSMWDQDDKILKQVRKTYRAWNPSIPKLIDFMKECYCVVGMKLHSCILSAAANVPFVSLGYRDKCFDFVQSMNLNNWIVRTDAKWAFPVFKKILSLAKYRGSFIKKIRKYKGIYEDKHKKIVRTL